MSTLIQRLREYTSEDDGGYSITHPICDEAAAEIERLRAELTRCGKDNCMGRLSSEATNWVTVAARDAAVSAERERCATIVRGAWAAYGCTCSDASDLAAIIERGS